MKHVLCISSLDFSQNGAAQRRHALLTREMCKAGFSVTLANPQKKNSRLQDVRIQNFPSIIALFPWRISALLWTFPAVLLAARKSDAILCFDRNILSMASAGIAAKIFRVPLFHEMTEHPIEVLAPGLKGRLTMGYFKRVFFPSLTGVSVISTGLETLSRNWNPKARTILIPAIAEIAESAPSLPPETTDRVNILYAGSLSEYKDGAQSLVHAFGLLAARNPNVRLTIMGYGSSAQRAALSIVIDDAGLARRVVLRDPVPQQELPSHLAQADILVLCRPLSRQAAYGFPTKLAEYLASRRAVITTATGDIGRYLRNGNCAILCSPNDLRAFARAMELLTTEPDLRQRIADGGWNAALRHFDAKTQGAKFAAWISSFLGAHRT